MSSQKKLSFLLRIIAPPSTASPPSTARLHALSLDPLRFIQLTFSSASPSSDNPPRHINAIVALVNL